MLAFIPVAIEAYRALKPRLWPIMQAIVAHADRAGCCWPSVRRIADLTGVPKSTVSRYLQALENAGHLSRTRKPGGRYSYEIASKWLPRSVSQSRSQGVPPASQQVSHQRTQGVPPARTEENTLKNQEAPVLPDDRSRWEPRLRGWHKARRWNPFWGPKPTEPGCFAPVEMLAARAS